MGFWTIYMGIYGGGQAEIQRGTPLTLFARTVERYQAVNVHLERYEVADPVLEVR